MGATLDWIASLTERCLHSYIHSSGNGIQWEDDGSNIRFVKFPSQTVTRALIKDWISKGGPLRAELTDSRNQIEVILPRYALRQYRKEIGDQELSKWDLRGYPMTLLEFEIVVEYSASKPAVHLFVERFQIEWDLGRHSINSGKMVKNDHGLSGLLHAAFSKAKGLQGGKVPDILTDGNESDTSIRSQDNTNVRPLASQDALPDTGISQEAFVSQVPAAAQPTTLETIPGSERTARSKKIELLRLLGHHPNGSERGTAATPHHVNQQGVNIESYPRHYVEHETQQCCSNRRSSKEVDGPSNLLGDRTHATTPAPEITATEPATSAGTRDLNSNANAESLPTTAVAEEGVNGASAEEGNQDSAAQGTNAESLRMDNTEPHVDRTIKRTGVANTHNKLDHVNSDPWIGMTRIRARDIRIPDDQKSLLENKRCWVPPSPGIDLPRGHVPPSLLARWNSIVVQKKPSTQDKQSTRTASGIPIACEISSPRSTNSSSQMDSGSGTPLSWGPSPSNRGPRNELPADSSPIRKGAARRIRSPNASRNGMPGSQTLRDIDHDRVGDSGENHSHPSHAGQDQMDATKSVSGNIAHPEHLDDESDGGRDSPMDTSVPCALGALTQQTQSTSQSGQEFTSSGSSLPKLGSQSHLQVIETPAADLSRLRAKSAPHKSQDSSKDGWEESSQQRSSQVGKSSSESWIMNTYASNGSETRGYRPQEAPILSQDEHGSNIDVMGTQVTGVNLEGDQASPQSQTGLVPDSSEAARPERSTSVPASASQAAPFSTYRGAPFSQSSTGSQDHGIFSSLGETRCQSGPDSSRKSPLKRSAAELEGGSPSPKRHKSVVHEDGVLRKSSTGDTKVSDALKAHEKFRNDYPSYSGGFSHFTELCHKLQCLRAGGRLTRSFLWDDFIIMHLQGYPRYLERCHDSKVKSLEYEEYFTSHFSKPLHRRRSMTASAIDSGAAQFLSADQPSPPPSVTRTRDEENRSFTHSLADKFSHFHAHSEQSPSRARSDVTVDRVSAGDSFDHGNAHQTAEQGSEAPGGHGRLPTGNSPAHINAGTSPSGQKRDAAKGHDALPTGDLSAHKSPSVEEPVGEQRSEAAQGVDHLPPAKSPIQHKDLDKLPDALRPETTKEYDPPIADSSAHRRSPTTLADESESSNIGQSQQRSSPPDLSQEIKEEGSEYSIPETAKNPESEDIDVKMEDSHDRGSIELGSAGHIPTSPPAPAHSTHESENAIESEAEEEPPSINENWFISLRHIRPSGPVWSDDRNTPFKAWARADLNVASERRRRGGRYLAVDENGVIQRSTTSSSTGH